MRFLRSFISETKSLDLEQNIHSLILNNLRKFCELCMKVFELMKAKNKKTPEENMISCITIRLLSRYLENLTKPRCPTICKIH